MTRQNHNSGEDSLNPNSPIARRHMNKFLAGEKRDRRIKKIKRIAKEAGKTVAGGVAIAPFVLAGSLMLELVTNPLRMAATIPINLVYAAVESAGEYVWGGDPQEQTGTVQEIGYTRLPQTKMALYWADMKLPSGELMRLSDKPWLIEGKGFNGVIPSIGDMEGRLAWYQRSVGSIEDMFGGGSENPLEIGKEYRFTYTGSERSGYTIISAFEK